jgi:hypothetical protein
VRAALLAAGVSALAGINGREDYRDRPFACGKI